MNLEDFEVVVKKYNEEKEFAIVNVTICDSIEIRGFRASPNNNGGYNPGGMWMVTPPSVSGKGRYFWIVRTKNPKLWEALKSKISQECRIYIGA